MSLITGFIKQVVGQPANDMVTIRPVVFPVVVGGALIQPDTKVLRADALGFWQTPLVQGYYEISVAAQNGQTAKVPINVPNDSNTYSFDQIIAGSLPVLSPPTNGVVPTAAPGLLGIVKVDTVDPDPVAVLGFYVKQTLVQMKAIPSKLSVKFVMLRSATREPGSALLYSFVFGDASVADGFNIVAPDDNLGRYFAEI
jgi:hypothetical protein